MATVPFYRLSGAGNDFLVLVEPREEPSGEWVEAACLRGVALGADGLFTLRRKSDGAVRMVHYNSDGGRAELCLNGTRCAVTLATQLGWGERIAIETDSGVIHGTRVDESTVELQWQWDAPPIAKRSLHLEDTLNVEVSVLDVGVPYAVMLWQGDITTAPVAELGTVIRNHKDLAPRGANVAFAQSTGDNDAVMRSFERGVEGETLASGTGVIATARCLAKGATPFTVTTIAGFQLTAWFEGSSANLRGDARLLASGEMHPQSLLLDS